MSIELPAPIAIYIAAENRGDAEALSQCFTEHAIVRDEGRTIEGLVAIKRWKTRPSSPTASAATSLEVPSSFSSSMGWTATRSPRWRSAHE